MILVIGGSFQGKKAYAAQICGGGTVLADFQDRIRAALEAEGKGGAAEKKAK